MLKIEKGIPIPATRQGNFRDLKYPFDKMEVGDSFETEDTPVMIRRRAHAYKTTHKGWDYALRKLGDKSRLWRIS